MKTIKNLIYLLFVAAFAGSTACSESAEYDKASPVSPDCMQVYFPQTNIGEYEVAPADFSTTTLSVTATRVKAEAAASIPIRAIQSNDMFAVPATIEFAAGATTTTFNITLTKGVVGQYKVVLEIADDQYVDPYTVFPGAVTQTIVVDLVQWNLVGTGTFFYNGWFEGKDPAVKLYQRDDKKSLYKIPEWGGGITLMFSMDKDNVISVPRQYIGADHASYGKVYIESASSKKKSYFDEAKATYFFNCAYVVDAGSFGTMEEKFVLPGGAQADPPTIAIAFEDPSEGYETYNSVFYNLKGANVSAGKAILASTAEVDALIAKGETYESLIAANGTALSAKKITDINTPAGYSGGYINLEPETSYTLMVMVQNADGAAVVAHAAAVTTAAPVDPVDPPVDPANPVIVGSYEIQVAASTPYKSAVTLEKGTGTNEGKYILSGLFDLELPLVGVYNSTAYTLTFDGLVNGKEAEGTYFGSIIGYANAEKTVGFGMFSGSGDEGQDPFVIQLSAGVLSMTKVPISLELFDKKGSSWAYKGQAELIAARTPFTKVADAGGVQQKSFRNAGGILFSSVAVDGSRGAKAGFDSVVNTLKGTNAFSVAPSTSMHHVATRFIKVQ